MKNKILKCKWLFLFFLIVIMMSSKMTILANTTAVKAKYVPTYIDLEGKYIEIDLFKISGDNYYDLNRLAKIFAKSSSQFNVVYNKDSIKISKGKKYNPSKKQKTVNKYLYQYNSAKQITKKIYLNDKRCHIKGYLVDGNAYFKLKDLSNLLSFDFNVSSKQKEVFLYPQTPPNAYRVNTANPFISNAKSFYFGRWSNTLNFYYADNKDGTTSIIEANEKVTIETYDDAYKLLSRKAIKYELPLFGGFYSGEKYNYIAFGQSNMKENDDREVIRIVQYDKSFKRINSVSIKGGESYTRNPFDAACGRMSENGGRLVFHTSRERYTTSDGLNHQSQLTIVVDTTTLKVMNDLGAFQNNHVSHSFDQYVQFDGDSSVLVDHGDAYPRSIVLSKESSDGTYSSFDLFEIPGSIGANCTGVSVGGFEISSENYIVAINSIDHALVKEYTSYDMIGLKIDQRDIMICSLPKQNAAGQEAKQITLAKYVGTNKKASIPQMVKISEDKFMVLWQEYYFKKGIVGDLKYVYIDKAGNAITKIKSIPKFILSECKPIKVKDKVVWYANEKGNRVFYTIPIE